MDLSKALDTIHYSLLLAKLKTYGFSKQALSFMCSYIKNRRQRDQINNKFSNLKLTILGFFDQIYPKRVFLVKNRKSEHHH